jgi:uncharacterized protein (DUF433 family)
MEIFSHIVIRDGKAYVEGRGSLKAEMVARMYVDGDYSIEEIMEHYNLSAAEVHAALTFYYDHRQALDAAHSRKLDEIHTDSINTDSHLATLRARQSASKE